MKLKNSLDLAVRMSRYNLKIVFANKFVYFLLAAFVFFLGITAIIFFSSDSDPDASDVYNLLLFPGILLVFYPTAFGIQNDVDSRMIEILFGIPNYRYKVWLLRLALIWLIVIVFLAVLALLSSAALVPVPIAKMVYQLMFPIFFLGCLSFMFSTLIRSGNGTAVVMVAIGMAFWISSGIIAQSRWNLFLNPFGDHSNQVIWAATILKNRIYLAVGSILALLYGLMNLQKREKFI
ncbi:MAG: hypothetical protein MUF59_08530 [Candidatus Krumholzibacteria bacterium]|nr:hypothetical protein [Candidatus Krumholzibacteria bacterium]